MRLLLLLQQQLLQMIILRDGDYLYITQVTVVALHLRVGHTQDLPLLPMSTVVLCISYKLGRAVLSAPCQYEYRILQATIPLCSTNFHSYMLLVFVLCL